MISRRKFLTMAGVGASVPITWAIGSSGGAVGATVPIEVGKMTVDLAGTLVETLGYNGGLPGPEIRLKEGEVLRVPVVNKTSEQTLIHWHGISMENAMDGTPLTQDPIEPGGRFNYEFIVPEAGSHWYHSHIGVQADYGMYGALIVEPRHEDLSYDREYTLVLDDWGHGVKAKPVQASGAGSVGARVGGYGRYARQSQDWKEPEALINFGGRAYPFLLVNGRPAEDPAVFDVRRGDRVRLRVINAAADTAFRFAVADHRLTVTHSDGMPVEHVTVDTVRIGMAERYDVIFQANGSGLSQIGLLPEGKAGLGRAVLRYVDSAGTVAPPPDLRPAEFEKRMLSYDDLIGTFPAKVARNSAPDKVFNMTLHHTDIRIDGLGKDDPIVVAKGDIVRFNIRNESGNWHPMHLHGHHFHLANAGRALKDTAVVRSKDGELSLEWHADNPGKWMFHCHNLYHNKDGMMRGIYYEEFLADFYNLPKGMRISDLCT